MPRNISKPFVMTLSLIDIEPLKPKYKCFYGEDVQLIISVIDENRLPVDLSEMSARVYYICDGVDLRQDDNITITDTMRGRLKVIVKRNYIRVGTNDVRVVLYDDDQEIMLQPATILCRATDISDVNPPPEDPAFDYKTEILKVKNTSINNQTNIGDISTLKTTVKSDLVAGINELKDSIETNTSQLEQKTDKATTHNIQTQVNNLVLGAVGDGNNAEVIQARGNKTTLNDRIDNIESGDGILDLVEPINIFNKLSATWGFYKLDGTTITTNAPFMYSDFIEIYNNRKIATKGFDDGLNSVPLALFYDVNKQYLGRVFQNTSAYVSGSYISGFIIDIAKLSYSSQIKYMCINGKISDSEKFMISYDSYPSSYSAWFEKYYLFKSTSLKSLLDKYYYLSDNVKTYLNKLLDDIVISCYGDSLTAGAGASASEKRYPRVLQSALGKKVNICAVGGEGAKQIALRQGGRTLFVEPFIIPSDKSAIEIQLKDIEGNNIILGAQGGYNEWGLNPCKINGIEGTIKYSNGKNTFERSIKGTSTTLTKKERVITNAFLNNMNDISIIWAGTNGTKSLSDLDTTISEINKMISVLNTKKYLVLGLIAIDSNYVLDVNTMENINKKLSETYGSHFVDIRKYILNYGLSDLGLSPTTQDNEDLANGIIPTSLRNINDKVHLNDNGYDIVGNYLAKIIKDNNWVS